MIVVVVVVVVVAAVLIVVVKNAYPLSRPCDICHTGNTFNFLFRFGHSMIREVFNMYSPKNSNKIIESYRLKDNYFNSTQYSLRDGHGMTETMVDKMFFACS